MSRLWHKTQKTDKEVVEIAFADFKVAGPTIVFLSGLWTTQHKKVELTDFINRLDEFVEDLPNESNAPLPKVYAWSHKPGLACTFNLLANSLFTRHAQSKADALVALHVIMPLVADNIQADARGLMTATPLAEDEARRRLRQLTLVAYSAGTVTAQGAFNAAVGMMKKIGYTKEKAESLMNEIVLFSTGHITQPKVEQNRFTTLYLAASNDICHRVHRFVLSPVKSLVRALFTKAVKALTIKPATKTTVQLIARMPRNNWEDRTSSGRNWRQKLKLHIPEWMHLSTQHEFGRYISRDEKLSPFVQTLRQAFARAIGRTELKPAGELVRPAPPAALKPAI